VVKAGWAKATDGITDPAISAIGANRLRLSIRCLQAASVYEPNLADRLALNLYLVHSQADIQEQRR
jgi:hypothetical protein